MNQFLHRRIFRFSVFLSGILAIQMIFSNLTSAQTISYRNTAFSVHSKIWNGTPTGARAIRMDYHKLVEFNSRDRAASAVDYHPDTVVVYSVENYPKRYTHFYSTEGELLIQLVKSLENGIWVNHLMHNYTYNSNGLVLTAITQLAVNGSWNNFEKRIYTYSNNKVETETVQHWNSGSWQNFSRVSHSFDLSSNVVASFMELWNGNSWENNYFELFVYDTQNRLLNATGQDWNGLSWQNDYYLEQTYNTLGLLSVITYKIWDSGAWANAYLEEFTYNDQAQLNQYMSKYWLGSGWIFADKYTYTYNSIGFPETVLGMEWAVNQWVNKEKAFFTNNNFGGIESALYEIWEAGAWTNDALDNCVYDAIGNAVSCEHFAWNGNTWQQNEDSPLELSYSNGTSAIRFSGYMATANYTSTLVGENSTQENANVLLYPNPASDHVRLTFSGMKSAWVTLRVFSAHGQLLQHDVAATDGMFELDIQNLPTGIYLIEIAEGKRLIRNKFIKQ